MLKTCSRMLFLSLFVCLSACTHTISHKPVPVTLPPAQNDEAILLVIPSETKNFTDSYSNLSGDKWIFEIGHALVDIAPQIFRNQYGSVTLSDSIPANFTPAKKQQLAILKILSFKHDIGWTIFSKHDGTLTLDVEIRGKTNAHQTITASGSDAGGKYLKTYGGLLLPTVGISGYNEAMSVMISNSVTAASIQALEFAHQTKGK